MSLVRLTSHALLTLPLLLGTILVGCSTSPDAPPSMASRESESKTRAKTAPELPVTRGVDVLATLALEEGVVGRSFPVSVTVEGIGGTDLRLVFNERHSQGSGATWRASEVSAAVQSMLATGIPPGGLQITYDVEGDVDGPSAGALITIGLMAAMQGHELLPDISMTGTINPDGSIGAVSMIPAKVRGASDEGIHTVLIPVGLRRGIDGEGPDVVEIGRSVGVEVKEVGDVYEAYEEMTGFAFDVPAQDRELPEFEPEFIAVLNARAASWRERYERYRSAINRFDRVELARFGSLEMMERAGHQAEAAERLRAGGRHAAAYDTIVGAARTAAIARFLPEALARYDASDLSSVRAWIDKRGHVERDLAATLVEIQKVQPVSFNDFVALSIAYAGLIEALSLSQSTDLILAGAVVDSKAARGGIESALIEAIRREVEASALHLSATDYLAFRAALATDSRPVSVDLDAIADVLSKAAQANLMLFESITLASVATSNNVSLDSVRKRFAARSETYREVIAVERFRERIDPHILDERHRALARVGLDLWRYLGAAELLATHYSLSVAIDPDTLRVERFAVTPPLKAMFTSSDKQIRRSLSALVDAHLDPQLVLATYQIGVEAGRAAVVVGDGPLLMRSLRHMWGTRVIAEAFQLGLQAPPPATR